MNQPRSVLIVDRSEDTREVLRTALERRGVPTHCAARVPDGLRLAEEHQPGLIVLDLDSAPGLSSRFLGQSPASKTPLVLLGTVRRDEGPPPQGEFVRKPYHYGPLIRKIEQLLERPEPCRAEVA